MKDDRLIKMFTYLIAFGLSIFFLAVGENEKHNKGLRLLSIAIGLLIPMFLAGLRKVGIGTDTEVYTNVLFNAAMNSESFIDYLNHSVYSNFQYKPVTNWEIGYNLLVYVATKVTNSIQGVFFVTHAIIIGAIYVGTKKVNGVHQTWWSMAAFYFLFYGVSLNLMRQWLAISIIYYGYHFLQRRQFGYYILVIILALQFHYSSILGILVALVYAYFMYYKPKTVIAVNGKRMQLIESKLLLLTFICLLSLLFLGVLASILGSINTIFARYSKLYISGTITIMPMQLIRRLPIGFILLVEWKKIKSNTRSVGFLCGMFLMDIITSQLGGITDQSARLGYYFSVYEILLFSELIRTPSLKKREIYLVFFIIYYLATFYYDFVLQGRAEIIPYRFYFN